MYELTAMSNHYWFIAGSKISGMKKKTTTRATVIANIRMLMVVAGDSEHSLGKKIGIRQSTISNMLSGRHRIDIEKAETIANIYGLEGWHLLLKDLPKYLRESKTISRLFHDYMKSSPEGRDLISRMADREAHYGRSDDDEPPTGTKG